MALGALVTSGERRHLSRRTPTKFGFRWFDGVFLALAVLGPLDAERRHPRWGVPLLLAVLGAWIVTRVVVWIVSRYRLVKSATARGVASVSRPAAPRPPRGAEPHSGVVRGLGETVQARLVERRCLATALSLESEAEPGASRLRAAWSAPFVVEGTDEPVVVRGEIELAGPVQQAGDGDDVGAALGVGPLDEVWLDGAVLREVLLQNRNRVTVWGGERRREVVEALAKRRRSAEPASVLEGVAANPVHVVIDGGR